VQVDARLHEVDELASIIQGRFRQAYARSHRAQGNHAALAMTLTAGDSPRAMSQEDVEIVTEFTRRFAAGRHVTDDYFAPEIVWDTSKSGMPAAGAITGREGVRRFFRDWLADWSDYEIEARDCIDAECAVLLVFRQAGTGKRGGREQALEAAGPQEGV
jgi:ketosteroid isomerase-like protein